MADNYLERKMEEYRSGKLASGYKQKTRIPTLHPATGYDVELLKANRVLILGRCLEGTGRELLKLFRSIGCRVAFCDADSKAGAQIAQATGCRFYPYDFSDVAQVDKAKRDLEVKWGGIDILIDLRVNDKNCVTL